MIAELSSHVIAHYIYEIAFIMEQTNLYNTQLPVTLTRLTTLLGPHNKVVNKMLISYNYSFSFKATTDIE